MNFAHLIESSATMPPDGKNTRLTATLAYVPVFLVAATKSHGNVATGFGRVTRYSEVVPNGLSADEFPGPRSTA
jgi:hypothetical protein